MEKAKIGLSGVMALYNCDCQAPRLS